MLDTFTQAYITAALWSSTTHNAAGDDVPLDQDYDESDLSDATRAAMESDCAAFYETHKDAIGDNAAGAGHDLWLTRCGHGAGFWDGDWPEPDATTLSDAAEKLGDVFLYVGDDGEIHT